MPKGLGNAVFKLVTASPTLHRWISNYLISSFADKGPLPGLYTSKERGLTPLRELLNKKYFAVEVPTPPQEDIDNLPDIEELGKLFERHGAAPESRVSLLLPLFAQHLTDAVFQSDGEFGTNAPHEIILNQIYGNTAQDEELLRLKQDGKLKTRTCTINGGEADFPDRLCEQVDGNWVIKNEYKGLSYLKDTRSAAERKNPKSKSPTDRLLATYKGREDQLCATGLFQGNMTLGNFAITALLVREHNRLCDGIKEELERKGKDASDQAIFKLAQQNNIVAYMKVVIEDYINAFAGQKLFKLDTVSFFHQKKRWCRGTPLPFHFNILYRIHSMIPDGIKGFEEHGYEVMLARNNLVMEKGVGAILQAASNQGAGQARLGNTHDKLVYAEKKALAKARKVLGSFNSHRNARQPGSSASFSDFDPKFRARLKELYKGKINQVEYAVGIFAELPKPGLMEKLGIKDDPIIGSTLMNAIATHAFRHILSNPYMTSEFLNPAVMTKFGWDNLHATSTVADLVGRNMQGEMDAHAAKRLRISFVNPSQDE